MKKLLIILLVIMALRPAIPLLEYVYHYDYIVNNLCENKEKPELKCNGKCHLAKELSKTTDTDDKKEVKFQNLLSIPAVVPDAPLFNPEFIVQPIQTVYFHYTEMQSFFSDSIDVPPCLMA